MSTAARMAWEAAGRPARPDATAGEGICLVCGVAAESSVPTKKALGANFDYLTGRGRGSNRVCVPCTWVLAGKPPATFRLWSIGVTAYTPLPPSMEGVPYPSDGRLHLCNRRDMSGLRNLLLSPPEDSWAVAVAQSGQKHILPYTPVNRPGESGWLVRWEAADVAWTPEGFRECLRAVADLRVHGHHPETISSGRPAVTALKGEGMTAWRRHEPTIRRYSGSPHMELALHFTTKENIHALSNL